MSRRALGWILVVLGGVGTLAVVVVWSTQGLAAVASPLLAILLPGLLLVLGLGLLRPRDDKEAGEPPEPVEEVEVNLIPKGPVSACLRCGSMKMQPAPLGADALFHQWRCANCGWRGQPLQFDSGADYAAFVKALREERGR